MYALSEKVETIFRSVQGLTETEEIPDYVFIDAYTTKATDFLTYINDNDIIIANATLHFYYTRYKVIMYGDDDPSSEPTAAPTHHPHGGSSH